MSRDYARFHELVKRFFEEFPPVPSRGLPTSLASMWPSVTGPCWDSGKLQRRVGSVALPACRSLSRTRRERLGSERTGLLARVSIRCWRLGQFSGSCRLLRKPPYPLVMLSEAKHLLFFSNLETSRFPSASSGQASLALRMTGWAYTPIAQNALKPVTANPIR